MTGTCGVCGRQVEVSESGQAMPCVCVSQPRTSPAEQVAMLRGMAARHREDAGRARALGQEASAACSERAARMLEREALFQEGGDGAEDTPTTTPKVLL